MCRAAPRLPAALFGINLLLASASVAAGTSQISSKVLETSVVDQADAVCFIQKDVIMHQKDAVNQKQTTFGPAPEGLDDWEKEFVSDRQGGPYYSDLTVSTTAAPADEEAVTAAPTAAPKVVAPPRDAFDVEEDSVSISIASALFGLAATIIASVYVLSVYDADKLAVSYGVVSSAMAAFMAALVYSSVKDLSTFLLFEYKDQPMNIQMTMEIGRFLFCFLMVEVLLLWFKNSERELKAVVLVGSFLCTYCAINAFEPFQHLYAFADTPFSSGTAVVLEVICMSIVFAILRQIRHQIHRRVFFDVGSNVATSNWDQYLKAVEEVECTMLGFSMGFLISRSAEFASLQQMPNGLPPPRGTWVSNTGSREVTMMFGGFLFFGACAACYATWAKFEYYQGHRKVDRTMQSFLFAASAWCGSTTVYYICSRGTVGQGIGGDLQWALSSAFVISVLCVMALVFICHNAHPHSYSEEAGEFVAYNILLQSIGLLIGTAWACCFTRAATGAAAAMVAASTGQMGLAAAMCFAFAVLIFMLWVFYVMPNTDVKAEPVEDLGHKFVHFSPGPKAWWPPQSWETGPSQGQ